MVRDRPFNLKGGGLWFFVKLFCAIIDFAAAFDTVWRDGLWNKLLINQINGKMYNIIV
jgi:hypothetical protein